jgi:ubiquinone/menaquinone biosynthesis C-methylase UbiE
MREKKAKKILEHVRSTYNEIATDFDRTRTHMKEDLDFLVPYLKDRPTIIDLGCGNGRFVTLLEEAEKQNHAHKFHYLGIDNNASLLTLAKKHFPEKAFIEGDQLQIPAEDEIADLLVNIRAFHHIPSKKLRRLALAEMRRVLKPHGLVIITVWNLWQKKYRKHIFFGILRYLWSFGGYAPNDTFIPWGKKAKRYYHAFLPLELNNLVTNAGFEIEDLFYVNNGKRVNFKECRDIVIIAKKVIQ